MNTYIVALNDGVDYNAFWNEIENISPTDGFVPSRRVDIVNSRDAFKSICEYALTEEEAEQLRNDPRIAAVERPARDLPFVKIVNNAVLDKNFDKTTSSTGDNVNWGLLRHSNKTNIYGNGIDDANNNYIYNLDGTGVDIVINDSGIQTGHPEFGSRLKTVNWTSYYSGYELGTNQNDTNGHGTHVAGIAAGKTYGWAKGADVYSLSNRSNSTGNTEAEPMDFFEALIDWHTKKTNNRPTVVNMSWALGVDVNDFNGTFTGGRYQDTPWTASVGFNFVAVGLINVGGSVRDESKSILPFSTTAYDRALKEVIDAGIIVVQAGGNSSYKIDKPLDQGGTGDYNNYFTSSSYPGLNFYYHRGASPTDSRSIVVGSLGANGSDSSTPANTGGDRQAEYSVKGPRIDIYAAGTNIMSSVSSNTGQPYQHGDTTFKQDLYPGTSMAAPQVAGIIALRLQQSPLANIKASTNCETIKSWLVDNSLKNQIFSPTTSTTDYANRVALLGAPNRIAYINPVTPYVKDDTNTWRQAKAVYVKHDDGTWKLAKTGWKKNDAGTWDKIYES